MLVAGKAFCDFCHLKDPQKTDLSSGTNQPAQLLHFSHNVAKHLSSKLLLFLERPT
jgi:hypothetical protein